MVCLEGLGIAPLAGNQNNPSLQQSRNMESAFPPHSPPKSSLLAILRINPDPKIFCRFFLLYNLSFVLCTFICASYLIICKHQGPLVTPKNLEPHHPSPRLARLHLSRHQRRVGFNEVTNIFLQKRRLHPRKLTC